MLLFDEWVGGSCVSKGRAGWELDVGSMEDEILLKVSVTGGESDVAPSEGTAALVQLDKPRARATGLLLPVVAAGGGESTCG